MREVLIGSATDEDGCPSCGFRTACIAIVCLCAHCGERLAKQPPTETAPAWISVDEALPINGDVWGAYYEYPRGADDIPGIKLKAHRGGMHVELVDALTVRNQVSLVGYGHCLGEWYGDGHFTHWMPADPPPSAPRIQRRHRARRQRPA